MTWISLLLRTLLLSAIVLGVPTITSRRTGIGFHTSKCLFIWHRLPSYLYVEPDELARLNATVLGSINIEAATSQTHPFAYCLILYNSTELPLKKTRQFSINIHSRYLDPTLDDNRLYETLRLPEPVIHFTSTHCPYLGSSCPPPLSETGIESSRELTVIIPLGQRKHVWFVLPITCLFPLVACISIFVVSKNKSC
jgi:hypothetical protein